MSSDEQRIRDVIARWHRATAAGDIEAVLTLVADDAMFLVAGRPPMKGRRAFETGLRAVLASYSIDRPARSRKSRFPEAWRAAGRC